MFKRYVSIIASVLLAVTMLLPATSSVALANSDVQQSNISPQAAISTPSTDSKRVSEAIEKVTKYVLSKPVSSDWVAVGLAKAGVAVPASYNEAFNQHIQSQIVGQARLKITDAERLTIAAVAIGKDPTNTNGVNLLDKIYNSIDVANTDTMIRQGTNGLIYALIALDTKNYEIPKKARWNREKIVAELLSYQREDGAWSLSTSSTGTASYDMTATALIGLAPYTDQPVVKKAVDRAVNYLSVNQGPTGGFDEAFVGGISSEATSQVIIGLTANQIDPRIPMFTKNGINLIDHLLSFQTSDGGFQHTAGDSRSNAMATEQALQALVAFDLFTKGKGILYNFTEVPVVPSPKPDPEPTPDPKPDPKPRSKTRSKTRTESNSTVYGYSNTLGKGLYQSSSGARNCEWL